MDYFMTISMMSVFALGLFLRAVGKSISSHTSSRSCWADTEALLSLNHFTMKQAAALLAYREKYYHEQDGWTQNAVEVLGRLDTPDAAPERRPSDPR